MRYDSHVRHTGAKAVFNSRKHVPGIKLETIMWLEAPRNSEEGGKGEEKGSRRSAALRRERERERIKLQRPWGKENDDNDVGEDDDGNDGEDRVGRSDRQYDFDFRYSGLLCAPWRDGSGL